ncbi:MAG: hypothetical protein ACLP3C_01725 [Mycobacterium sp.]
MGNTSCDSLKSAAAESGRGSRCCVVVRIAEVGGYRRYVPQLVFA